MPTVPSDREPNAISCRQHGCRAESQQRPSRARPWAVADIRRGALAGLHEAQPGHPNWADVIVVLSTVNGGRLLIYSLLASGLAMTVD